MTAVRGLVAAVALLATLGSAAADDQAARAYVEAIRSAAETQCRLADGDLADTLREYFDGEGKIFNGELAEGAIIALSSIELLTADQGGAWKALVTAMKRAQSSAALDGVLPFAVAGYASGCRAGLGDGARHPRSAETSAAMTVAERFNPTASTNWRSFRGDDATNRGWCADCTVAGGLEVFRRYRADFLGKPDPRKQWDAIRVDGPTVMLTGATAGGDPPIPHGSCYTLTYLSRENHWLTLGGAEQVARPLFPSSIRPAAGIETASGWGSCQVGDRAWVQESGRWLGWKVYANPRVASDTYGPLICDDHGYLAVSVAQWHGGGQEVVLGDWTTAPFRTERLLWKWLGEAPTYREGTQPLPWMPQISTAMTADRVVTNVVSSALRRDRLAEVGGYPPHTDGLTVWDRSSRQALADAPGAWGNVSIDPELRRVYVAAQEAYPRDCAQPVHADGSVGDCRVVPGGSRFTAVLDLDTLEQLRALEDWQTSPPIQDAPLVGPDHLVLLGQRAGATYLVGYDRRTLERRWETEIPFAPSACGCPYWPGRNEAISSMIGVGRGRDAKVIVANSGLLVVDASTGAIEQEIPGYYRQPVAVVTNGRTEVLVLGDPAGPACGEASSPYGPNCAGDELVVLRAGALPPATPAAPPATATRTATASRTSTATATRTPTEPPTATRTPSPTRTSTGTATASQAPTSSATAPPTSTPTVETGGETSTCRGCNVTRFADGRVRWDCWECE